MVLRRVLTVTTQTYGMAAEMRTSQQPMVPQALRMAIVVITTIPIMLVYPFLQKYYTKGIIMGSIKSKDSLAEYIARPPLSLKKIRYEPFKGKVLFHTKYSDYFKENVHLFDALEFLAELT